MSTTAHGLHFEVHDLRPPWRQTGETVLLHHGIGTDRNIWAEWLSIIAPWHRVVRFDMRGFGESVIPSPDYEWTMDALVADLWEVADAVSAKRVHLVGESMGGTIALAAAAQEPERTLSVHMLNATYIGNDVGEVKDWHAQFEHGPEAWSHQMMLNRFAPGVGDPDALAWFARRQAATLPHVATGLGRLLSRTDLTSDLGKINMPVDIVHPDKSPFVPLHHGEAIVQQLPDARLHVVHGVRHGLPFSHARQEAKRLLAILKTRSGRL